MRVGLSHLLLALACGLAGCAPLPVVAPVPPQAASLPAVPLLRLAPATLGGRLALQQQIEVQAPGRTQSLEALLEVDERELRLALLSLGQVAARLQWDGVTLTQSQLPGLPALPAERILSELQLVWWPADALRAALPAGWTLDDSPDWAHPEAAGLRVLRHDGAAAIRIERAAAQDGTLRVTLAQLRDGYVLHIASRRLAAEAAP